MRGLLHRNDYNEISRLKNKYEDSRIFILGNGPSLNITDLSLLVNEVSIASNSIFLLFEKNDFRPTFYTVEDNLVAEDRADEINSLKGFYKIIPLDLMKYIVRDENTIYINFVRNYRGFPRFSKHFERKVFWGGTVTFLNLQLAYHLGASEIILIGVDHNYQEPNTQDIVNGTVIESKTTDNNHFDPNYFGPGYRWHNPRIDRMEMAYLAARNFFRSRKKKVYNATIGGKLEVFPRVDYYDLFS